MDAVVKWASALCVAAITCTALQILAPKKGMGRIFRLITAAFFLCCMASPMLSIYSDFNLNVDNVPPEVSADIIKERVKQQFEQQVNVAMTRVAEQTLKNYDIKLSKIDVNMDTGEDGSIYISGVVLYLDKQDRSKAIAAKQILEQRLDVEVTVLIIQE
ncbi:MAG: stage III sporulation protein AF [Oscillospiraceae bacterium]|nr:stage III sporulation protein AF [Oscillospiraceae bacterium]